MLLKTFDEYYNGYTQNDREIRGYAELVEELQAKYPVGEQIVGEQNKKELRAVVRCDSETTGISYRHSMTLSDARF